LSFIYPTGLICALQWPRMKSLHPISDAPPPERTRALWPSVRFFIETIWALFGGPEVIAALRNMAREDYKLLASWLHKAEALVRKLILIEASEAQIEEKKYKPRPASTREPVLRQFFEDEPQLWRVSFRLSEPKHKSSKGRRSLSENRFPSAWPLAERFEALLRVFDAPEAYIKRAARLMLRKADDIERLLFVPLFEGFEDIFEPLRPLLCNAGRARLPFSNTS
jgi:hypothetical protein